jgi:hypothetical protein
MRRLIAWAPADSAKIVTRDGLLLKAEMFCWTYFNTACISCSPKFPEFGPSLSSSGCARKPKAFTR